jgi:hypothetical protein
MSNEEVYKLYSSLEMGLSNEGTLDRWVKHQALKDEELI